MQLVWKVFRYQIYVLEDEQVVIVDIYKKNNTLFNILINIPNIHGSLLI